MSKFLFLIGAVFTLLVLRPTPGWCADEFEVVWEHDLSYDDFYFMTEMIPHTSQIYALSSDVDNFLVYQDNYYTFKVLDLTTGAFIKRVIVIDTNTEFPTLSGIKSMQLIEDKTKLAVAGKNGYYYIYDVKTWELLRKVQTSGLLSNDGKLLFVPVSGNGGYIYDFETMKKIYDLILEEDAGYSPTIQNILISDDGKRAACSRWMDGRLAANTRCMDL